MKKLIIAATIIGALGLAGTSALAAGGNHLENRMARMQQALSLSDAQAAQIKTLSETQHANRKASRETHRQQIEALLTAEQKEKFNAKKQKRGHKMGKHSKRGKHDKRGGRGSEDRMARMQQKLGLSDTQVAQIKALRETQRTAAQASRESHRQQIEALLTPEQQAKFSAMKQKRGKRGGHKHQRGDKQQGAAE